MFVSFLVCVADLARLRGGSAGLRAGECKESTPAQSIFQKLLRQYSPFCHGLEAVTGPIWHVEVVLHTALAFAICSANIMNDPRQVSKRQKTRLSQGGSAGLQRGASTPRPQMHDQPIRDLVG
jgi:hypothetical protein